MYFESLSELLLMSGHGRFVWSAYGITFFVVFVMLLQPMRRQQKMRRLIAQKQQNIRHRKKTLSE